MHNLEALWALTYRDIQIRFKQSIIGIGWAILQPLALMFVFTMVFSRLLQTDSEGIPYPIFVYSCVLPWTFFAASLMKGTASIASNSAIIKKVGLPHALFPVASILAALVDFFASTLVFVVMCFWYHVSWNPWMLLVIPLILLQILLTIGLSFFLSALNAYFRDITYALPLVVQVWFYASPIVYAISVVPQRFMWFYRLNPMVGLMDGYRSVLVKGIAPDWQLLGIAALVTGGVMVVGYATFSRLEGNFSDVI